QRPHAAVPGRSPDLRGLPRRRAPRRLPGALAMKTSLLLFTLLASAGAAAAPAPKRPAQAMVELLRAPASPHGMGGDTRCAACHTAESWTKVTFDHDRTGFPPA